MPYNPMPGFKMPDYKMSWYQKVFPLYRFFADGRAVVVQNQTQWDALEAGRGGREGAFTVGDERDAYGMELPIAVSDHPPDASGLTVEIAEMTTSAHAVQMREEGTDEEEIASVLGISRRTLTGYLGEEQGTP
jgi:hypothetical protein